MHPIRRFAARDAAWAADARARRTTLIGLAAGLWATMVLVHGGGDPMQPDSLSYLVISPLRTAGYPLFLKFMLALGLTPGEIAIIQAGLLAAAAASFASCLARRAGSLFAPAIALGLTLGHPLLGVLAMSIVTEALFAAILMLAARTALDGRWLLLGLLIGLALTVRPTGWALLPAAALAVLASPGGWHARAKRAGAILIVCLACALAGAAAKRAWAAPQSELDFGRFSLLGRVLLETPRDRLDAIGLGPLAPRLEVIGAVLARAPDWRTRYLLNAVYYNRILWDMAVPTLGPYRAALGPEAFDKAVDDALMAALAENGPALLAMAARDFAALWTLADLMTRDEAAAQMRAIGALGPLPDQGAYPYAIGGRPAALVFGVRAILALGFLASLILPILAIRARADEAAGILFLALASHGAFALTALANTGLPRYGAVIWPLLLALIVLAYARARQTAIP